MAENEIDSIVENLSRILPILGKIMMRGVKSKTTFAPHVVHVMGALSCHGKLTMTGIGSHLSLPKPQVTTLIDRLVGEKLVERQNDENDRRIIYIQLTETGKEKFQEIKDLMSESLRNALVELDEETLGSLKDSSSVVCKVMIEINDKQRFKCCQNSEHKINE